MGPMGRLERRRRAHVDVRHRGCRRGDGRTRYGTSRGIQVRSPSGPRPPLRRADPIRREGDRGGRADTGPGGMEARGRRRRGRVATSECARGVVPRGPIVRRPGRQARQGQGEEGRRCEQQRRRRRRGTARPRRGRRARIPRPRSGCAWTPRCGRRYARAWRTGRTGRSSAIAR